MIPFSKIRNFLNFNETSKLTYLKHQKELELEYRNDAYKKRFQIPFEERVYETPIESNIFIESGLELVQQAMFLDAADHFTKAILHNPKSYEGFFYRGLSRLNIGDIQGCIVDLTNATIIKPDYGLAYDNLADIYYKNGEFVRAVQNFDLAIQNGRIDYYTYYKRGLVNKQLKNYVKVIKDFTMSLDLNPTFARAYLERGMVFNLLKNQEAAMSDFNRVIEMDVSSTNAYFMRADIFYQINDFVSAKKDFQKSAELGSDNALLLVNHWDHYVKCKSDWFYRIFCSLVRLLGYVIPKEGKN